MYHHTGPMAMVYAMREALRIVNESGLQKRWARHHLNAAAVRAGLEGLGLDLHADPEHYLPSLTTVRVPEGIDDTVLRNKLLNDFNIEIGGGLGDLK